MIPSASRPALLVPSFVAVALLVAGAAGAQAADGDRKPRRPWPVRPERKARPNPLPASPETLERGRRVYLESCAECHGASGRGDGPKAFESNPPATDLTAPEVLRRTDGELEAQVSDGRPPMTSFERLLSAGERWAVIHHLRTLAPAPAPAAPQPLPATTSAVVTGPSPLPDPESGAPGAERAPGVGGVTPSGGADATPSTPASPSQPVASPVVVTGGAAPGSQMDRTISLATPPGPAAAGPDDIAVRLARLEQRAAQQDALIAEQKRRLAAQEERLARQEASGAAAPSGGRDHGAACPDCATGGDGDLRAPTGEKNPYPVRIALLGHSRFGAFWREGEDPTFNAGVAPHMLVKFGELGFFESGIDFYLDNHDTRVNLFIAATRIFLHDSLTVGGGIFLTPFGFYNESIHEWWLNKLPDEPLPVAKSVPLQVPGLVPQKSIGVDARLAVPLPFEDTRLHAVLYATNSLHLEDQRDPARQGTLDTIDIFPAISEMPSLGGRVSLVYLPLGFEVGASVLYGRVGESGTALEDVDALLYGFDVGYIAPHPALLGRVEVRGELIAHVIDRADYGLGRRFRNNPWGAFVQASYRPTMVEVPVLSELEPVARYDVMEYPGTLGHLDRERWTFGLAYWPAPTLAIKAAYQLDDLATGLARERRDVQAFLFQLAWGF